MRSLKRSRLAIGLAAGFLVSAGTLEVACSSSSSSDAGGDSGVQTHPDATSGDTGAPVEASTTDASDAGRPEPTISLGLGNVHTCALKSGVVTCWGSNNELAAGVPDGGSVVLPTVVSDIGFTPTKLFVGPYATCVGDGTNLSCWGPNNDGAFGADAGCGGSGVCGPSAITAFGTVTTFGVGSRFACALSPSGAVACSGEDFFGELAGDGGSSSTPLPVSGISNIAELHVSWFNSCLLLNDRTVNCWGDDEYGETGQLSPDGGPFDLTPHKPGAVPGVASVQQLSAGAFSSCALLADHTVSCWGYDGSGPSLTFAGQLGHDPTTDPQCGQGFICDAVPTKVVGLNDAREVSAGYYASCAVKMDDTVVCWGDDSSGLLNTAPELDGGNNLYNFTPQAMPGLTNVAHVYVATTHACAVTWDDHVLCWGDNGAGQLGVSNDPDGGISSSPAPVTPLGF